MSLSLSGPYARVTSTAAHSRITTVTDSMGSPCTYPFLSSPLLFTHLSYCCWSHLSLSLCAMFVTFGSSDFYQLQVPAPTAAPTVSDPYYKPVCATE